MKNNVTYKVAELTILANDYINTPQFEEVVPGTAPATSTKAAFTCFTYVSEHHYENKNTGQPDEG